MKMLGLTSNIAGTASGSAPPTAIMANKTLYRCRRKKWAYNFDMDAGTHGMRTLLAPVHEPFGSRCDRSKSANAPTIENSQKYGP